MYFCRINYKKGDMLHQDRIHNVLRLEGTFSEFDVFTLSGSVYHYSWFEDQIQSVFLEKVYE